MRYLKSIGSVLVMMTVWSCSKSEKTNNDSPKAPLKVEAYKVLPQPFSSRLVTTGNILAFDEVELKAPIGGTILEVLFKEGQKIKKGQSIIHLDDRTWKAQLIGLKAELKNAEKDYERKQSLLDVEGSSQQEIDAAFTEIEKLKSQIQLLQVNIALANVKAPFSGNLGMRNISPGAYLSQGEMITTLVNRDKLRLDFALPQLYQSNIRVGSDVMVYYHSDTLPAKVYAINPKLNASSRTLNIRARIDHPEGSELLPGAYVEVAVPVNALKEALLVPTQAIVPEIEDQTVYVYHKGVATRKTIKLGNRTKDSVHVLEGLSVGDTIITTGLLKIKDSLQVDIQLVD